MSNASQLDQLGTPRSFLNEVYQVLGYEDGALLNAVKVPESGTHENEEWLNKGDWLALAKKAGAEKVFFVNDDPVLVFCEFQHIPNDAELLDTFRRIWCMARPQCLFIAMPDVLRVYRLNQPPAKNIRTLHEREIAVVEEVKEVAEKLRAYRREQVESGRLFAEKHFGGIDERADKRLIQDLKMVRKRLLDTKLNQKFVHALIGRSIFIRYLEDRNVLTSQYFQKIAKGNPKWEQYLAEELEKPDFMQGWEKRKYVKVLRNKEFTYALFNQLATDFNGDMFPKDLDEEKAIDEKNHLAPLRDFLLGDPNSEQLFFWAYDFEIIPIELISSIYEEFYHKENIYDAGKKTKAKQDDKGTHYTPSVLVEYVLSQVLTKERLATKPKILDPACGSGIFLVEAFRRIVRHEVKKKGDMLSPDELRNILCEQIWGIEINEEAIRIAAFSLYLALLHYQEPPDILQRRLPNLIYTHSWLRDEDHYHILFEENTFVLTDIEHEQVNKKLQESPLYDGRVEDIKLSHSQAVLPLSLHSFDIIVGNPPWGFEKGATAQIVEAQKQAERWSKFFGWSIGDKELSQAFIARSLSLLKPEGECGLLVSTGVLFKHHENSRAFRRRWLKETTLKSVVNFAHVRHAFFNKKANAPFAFVHFEATPAPSVHWVHYRSAKRAEVVDKIQIVVLSQPDIRLVQQTDLEYNDFLWKVYWWGNHRDAALIKGLRLDTTLRDLATIRKWPKPGRGFEDDFPTGDHKPSGWLKNYKALPTKCFSRYGDTNPTNLEVVPEKVHRHGDANIQTGWRLLIGRGIDQAYATKGRVEARLEGINYCFRNSIHGVNVNDAEDWERKILIGITWSSLARYYYFMTASSWGTWHHEIHLEEAMSLPVRFPEDNRLRDEIVEIVDTLMQWPVDGKKPNDLLAEVAPLEQRLDAAIFDLYELTESERDLILDMCEVNLEFFYEHSKSKAAHSVEQYPTFRQGTASNLPGSRIQEKGLEGYIYAFLKIWNRELEPDGEFRWRIIRPSRAAMIAVVFTTQEEGDALPIIGSSDDEEWNSVLVQCRDALRMPVNQRIYIDSMVRVVTDTEIYIIKCDERRLWTRSMAREDAEATLLQAMYLQETMQAR